MALWKRAETYYVDITSPDGSRIRQTTGTTDRTKAKEYHDKLKAELWDLSRLKQKPKRTWDEAALRWLKEKEHKKSLRDDVQRIRWFTGHLRGKTLDQIDRSLVDGLITKHIHATDRTKDLYVAVIRGIFRIAMREWEWLDQIPAFKTYEKNKKVRVRWITHEQARTLLLELPEHQRDVVVFALSTGLRQGNVLGMTWDRIFLARRSAIVDHGATKNADALGVALNDIAVAVLERQQGKHKTAVFTYRGEPLRSANTRAWRKALVRAGIRTAGMMFAIPGRAGCGRRVLPLGCFRNSAAGNRNLWCAAMRTCRPSICSPVPTSWDSSPISIGSGSAAPRELTSQNHLQSLRQAGFDLWHRTA